MRTKPITGGLAAVASGLDGLHCGLLAGKLQARTDIRFLEGGLVGPDVLVGLSSGDRPNDIGLQLTTEPAGGYFPAQ